MDYGRLAFGILGFSASVLFFLPNLSKWQRQQTTTEKLKMVKEALEEAEERARKYEERHDRLLNQICSYYLTNKELELGLIGARASMNDAIEFAADLRCLQLEIIGSYPRLVDSGLSSDGMLSRRKESVRLPQAGSRSRSYRREEVHA